MKTITRVALRALDLLPASIADVLLLRNDDRVVRVVVADHDLALEGFLE
jgi:transcription antitermination factor NusA-like protein